MFNSRVRANAIRECQDMYELMAHVEITDDHALLDKSKRDLEV